MRDFIWLTPPVQPATYTSQLVSVSIQFTDEKKKKKNSIIASSNKQRDIMVIFKYNHIGRMIRRVRDEVRHAMMIQCKFWVNFGSYIVCYDLVLAFPNQIYQRHVYHTLRCDQIDIVYILMYYYYCGPVCEGRDITMQQQERRVP